MDWKIASTKFDSFDFFLCKKPHPRFQGWGWGCGGEIIYKPLCSMYFPSSKNKQNME